MKKKEKRRQENIERDKGVREKESERNWKYKKKEKKREDARKGENGY